MFPAQPCGETRLSEIIATNGADKMTSTITTKAAGPLVVSERNPRYFTPASGPDAGRAVYLTGSHIWNNLQDGMGPGPEGRDEPERMDFADYLRFLTERGHNFIRLWRWEQFRSQAAGGNYHLNMSPQPWLRTGPGVAKDGKPRFDLDRQDDAYFERLRDRVMAAGDAGIYVGVMLFDGWALHLSPAPDHIEGHPFHADSNVNGIAASSIDDLQVLPLDGRIQAIQDAYIRRVIDTLHDLPNLLWEVANESAGGGTVTDEFAGFIGLTTAPDWGDTTEWQYRVIDLVKEHEREHGYDVHPIGMTMQFPVAVQTAVNDPLLASRADWISPGYDDEIFADGGHPMAPGSPPSRWYAAPPVADGAKVIISDSDHYAPGQGDALWAWKTFLRGNHPILMDFGLIAGLEPTGDAPADSGVPPFEAYEPARWAMGDTRRYAERVALVDLEPRSNIASTGYALVNPGVEYLVLQPEESGGFGVDLDAGEYRVEWFDIANRETRAADPVVAESQGSVAFRSPFPGPAVLYLSRIEL